MNNQKEENSTDENSGDAGYNTSSVPARPEESLASITEDIDAIQKEMDEINHNKYLKAVSYARISELQKQLGALKKREKILKTQRRLVLISKVRRWMRTAMTEMQQSSLSWYLDLDADTMARLKAEQERKRLDADAEKRREREALEEARRLAEAKRLRIEALRREKRARELRKKAMEEESARRAEARMRRLEMLRRKQEKEQARLRRGEEKRRQAGWRADQLMQALESGWQRLSAPPRLRTVCGKPQKRVVVCPNPAQRNYFPSVNKQTTQQKCSTPQFTPRMTRTPPRSATYRNNFIRTQSPVIHSPIRQRPVPSRDMRRPMKAASPDRRSRIAMKLDSATTHHVLF